MSCVSLNFKTIINVPSMRATNLGLFSECTFNGTHGFACPIESLLTTGRLNTLGFSNAKGLWTACHPFNCSFISLFGAIFLSPTWRRDADIIALSVAKSTVRVAGWRLISITYHLLLVFEKMTMYLNLSSFCVWNGGNDSTSPVRQWM